MNVLQSIESSAQASLPSVGGAKQEHVGQPGQVAGWTEHVNHFMMKANSGMGYGHLLANLWLALYLTS